MCISEPPSGTPDMPTGLSPYEVGNNADSGNESVGGSLVRRQTTWILCSSLLVSGCSGPQPVLYSNSHLESVGKETAEQDIEACGELAEGAGAEEGSGGAGQVAKSTAMGSGMGAASGAVGGAISGGAGLGSLIGAASGAVWGLLLGLFGRGSSQPSQAYTNYVNRCLQDKGYEVAGWQ